MIELPEALVIAKQINQNLTGKQVHKVIAAQSPHKFAWYYGDPQEYPAMLVGRRIDRARGFGGFIEIELGQVRLLFSDGVGLRFHDAKQKRPAKHQLLIEFTDGTALTASVQMYGGLMCFPAGELDNQYYKSALEKPSPLSDAFDWDYFASLLSDPGAPKLSVKAFLATEQRIPGLGNGTLQDILYCAGIHPKRKISGLTEAELQDLFDCIKETMSDMLEKGGRDTEKDLFGRPGSYQTKLSKNTVGQNCSQCSSKIVKEAYLGGSIYYCPECQKMA